MKSSEEKELNPAFVLIGYAIATVINTTVFTLASRGIGWTEVFIPMAVVVFVAALWSSVLTALAKELTKDKD